MGLENTQQLYNYIGRPLDKMYIVHVAGTNGKGSVSLKTAECLKRSGLKTGLFVSPHISSFRERVQINGNPLNEEDLADFITLQKTQADSENSWTLAIQDIEQTTCDLSAKNPHKKLEAQLREPAEILEEIQALDRESAEILKSITKLLKL
jgi:folylpolyglutamate synthase/dihydropteroate synthase